MNEHESSGTKPEAKAVKLLTARLREQHDKNIMVLHQLNDILFPSSDLDTQDRSRQFVQALLASAQGFADTAWVTSMRLAELPDATILELWDTKDEISREAKAQEDDLS